MKAMILAACLLASGSLFAEENIDWKTCANDLAKICAKVKGEHEKHECLEKAGDKVSKACRDFNHSLEGKFKKHHKDDHSH